MGYMNYEERLEVAKRLYELSNDEQKTALECIFPELKESEDKRIRKELIEHVKDQQSSFISAPDCRDKYEEEENNKYNSWLSWLEKQGEQKLPIEKLPEEMKTIGESLGFTTQEECDKYNQMVSDLIMCDDDKDKLKFKVGDWVICGKLVTQITSIENDGYTNSDQGFISFETAKKFHLWTIKDVKAGDIIAVDPIDTHPSPFVAIYKKQNEEDFESYCFVGFDGKFYKGENGHSTEEIHPATKEQRDILFAKIKEAGYEWDENNKMLKEIVEDEEEPQNYKNQIMSEITDLVKHYIKQKPTCGEAGEDMKEALRTEYEKGRADAFSLMQKEWSEEDEKLTNRIEGWLDTLCDYLKDSSPEYIEDVKNIVKQLKSLKERYIWKPSSELGETSYQVGIKRVLENPESYGLTKYNWKPSDEQMEALNDVISSRDIKYDVLSELWKDLNKLKGE